MANKEYENVFCYVSNAHLFSSSEHTEVLPMSIMAVNIAAAFHIFISIIGHSNKTMAILAHDHRYHK